MKLTSLIVAAAISGMTGTTAWAQMSSSPAVAPPPPRGAMMAGACKQNIQTLCPGIAPGGGRLAECFRTQFAKLSPGCKSAIKENRMEHQAASAPAPLSPASATPPPH